MAISFVICPCAGLSAQDIGALDALIEEPVKASRSALCASDPTCAAEAVSQPDTVLCCGQDPRLVDALADELGVPTPSVIDLNARAGWPGNALAPLAKLAAILTEAVLPAPPAKSIDVVSEGLCLILGPADVTLPVAEQLAPYLSVTVLLSPKDEIPDARGFDVVVGHLRRATGALGHFEVTIDHLQQVQSNTITAAKLSAARDGGQSSCDILMDLRGEAPLFSAHEKREGYLRADPAHPPAVAAATLAASHLTGTFEKPLYVRTEPLLCAHSRASQTGCSRCLDLCPTGAISPSGDHVSVDPMICAGCGACSAACPTGAISYDVLPVDLTMRRVQTLAMMARAAGAATPKLLVHDGHGEELIRLATRHFGGLPADVIPISMPAIGAFGHAEALAALAAGFADVALLPGPGADRIALETQVALASALSGDKSIRLLDVHDPEHLAPAFSGNAIDKSATIVRPVGSRRQVTRQASRALNQDTTQIALPAGAPYGAIVVDTDACTLCLSCVSLCPSGALGDNADKPQLRFQEDACVQCGICVQICPEDAIGLEPRMDLTDAALSQVVLNEEEPFACISCGALFGSKSTIERMAEKLADHPMFTDPEKRSILQMCDECRIAHQVHSTDNPFQQGERPRPRTTDDYLSARRDH